MDALNTPLRTKQQALADCQTKLSSYVDGDPRRSDMIERIARLKAELNREADAAAP